MINRFVVSKLELSDEKVADLIPVGEGVTRHDRRGGGCRKRTVKSLRAQRGVVIDLSCPSWTFLHELSSHSP